MAQIRTVQRLTAAQLPAATAMLGRAFHHDLFSLYIYPDEVERARRLWLMFSIAARYTLSYGEISITGETGDVTGAACWLPPESTHVSFFRLLRIGAVWAGLQMGLSAALRLNSSEDYMKSEHDRWMKGPHWYLWTLGAEPALHGQGIGGRLLRAGLERADAAGLPCYLETMNPRNVPLYEKFGFVVAGKGDIPGSCVHMWSMVRPMKA